MQLLHVTVGPIPVYKEVPKHDHNDRNCQCKVMPQEICIDEANSREWKKCE
jgi:hypothetical protein